MSSLLLVAALLKGQRFDFLIEKATEVGVDSVWPVCAERSVVQDVSPRKVERWRRLAHEAAKQCGRTRTPLVADPAPLGEAMRRLAGETQQAFMAVPAAEGEGDLSLDWWRDAHRRYFERNGGFNPDMMLWCEHFRVVAVFEEK